MRGSFHPMRTLIRAIAPKLQPHYVAQEQQQKKEVKKKKRKEKEERKKQWKEALLTNLWFAEAISVRVHRFAHAIERFVCYLLDRIK